MLAVSQIALSLILLAGAGLVLRSYAAARQANVGFDSEHVTSVAIDLHAGGYRDDLGSGVIPRLLDTLEAEPSFVDVTLAMNVPMSLVDGASRAVAIEGYEPRPDEDMVFLYNTVAPNYFHTLRIPLIAGRDFARTDHAGAAPAVIINETLARRMWQTPDNAIGRRIRSGTSAWRTVIGVAADVKYSRLSDGPRPFVYFPLLQNDVTSLTVHARARGDVNFAMQRVRNRIQAVDPAIPIVKSMTLTEQAQVALSIYEMAARALTIFGIMTMALAAIGIYGLIAYTVRQSTHEIGIRIALGASRADVIRAFVGRGAVLGAIGAAIGLIAALAASGTIGSLLYGVGARDFTTFSGATVLVMGIALLASFIPAWKASKIDPLAALRHQ